jgi:prepilin-type N-terminal cleavage/methylation domain-containing protein
MGVGPATRYPPCSRRSIDGSVRRGVTLVELLVTTAVVGLLLGLVLPIVLSNRRTVELDQVRTSVNQTLRAAHDLIAADLRIAGERFNEIGLGVLSPVQLGVAGDNSVLTLRRALEEWLPVCDDDPPLTGTTITVAVIGEIEPQRCIAQRTVEIEGVDWPPNVLAWRDLLADSGGQGTAYIHDPASGVGQFFGVEIDHDEPLQVQCVDDCTWDASAEYSEANAGIVGLLDVFEYFVADGVLVRRNAVTGDELRIADGISSFAVSITRDDGSGADEVVTEFPPGASWARIRSVNVTLAVTLDQGGTAVDREMAVSYFPRNVLSR